MNLNDVALLKSAAILLVAGMGMTFLFLLVQVFCTKFFSKLSAKFAYLVPEPEPKKPVKKPAAATSAPKVDNGAVVAAIAAAIHHSSK